MVISSTISIGIIGSGFSGTLTAINLIRKYNKPLKLFLIDKDNFAKGVAYNTDDEIHLLNVPANKMSAFSDNPNHFIEWLNIEKEKGLIDGFNQNDFMPRKLYGKYLSELLNEYEIIAKHKNMELVKINDYAIDVNTNSENNQNEIIFKNNPNIIVDKLVLALGNYPPANINIETSDFYSDSKYFKDPWNKNKSIFEGLKVNDPILLIGSGLTMVDIALSLDKINHKGNIFVISPHGYIPEKHSEAKVYPTFFANENLPNNVLSAFKIVKNEIIKAENQGFNKHNVIDSIRPFSQKIWLNFSLIEKKNFMKHLRHRWGVLRHRMSEKAFDKFYPMLESGQLKIYAGKINSFIRESESITVNFKNRKNNTNQNILVDRIINCTGPESNYNNIGDELVKNLRSKEIISADSMNLGINSTPQGNTINNDNISENIFTLGSTLKGILWESTAVPELRLQANNLAELIIKGLNNENNPNF